jgi:hypothetical protein
MDLKTIINKISKMLSVPGGKRATGIILEKIGALAYIQEIVENEYLINKQNKLAAGLQEWFEQEQPDLDTVDQMIKNELNLATKENFMYWFGETFDTPVQFMVEISSLPYYLVMINHETHKEFEKFVPTGLIELITDPSDSRLSPRRPGEKIFDDKKRSIERGFKCVIQIRESFYQ